MEKEAKLNKVLYKIFLLLLKIIPMLLAIIYFSNTICSNLGYDFIVFSIVGGMSILPTIYFYLASYVFHFCSYHRLPLHYIVLSDCISWYDYSYGIPIENRALTGLNLGLFGFFIIIFVYLVTNERKHKETNYTRTI